MVNLREFENYFNSNPARIGHIGVEREGFVTCNETIVPEAAQVLGLFPPGHVHHATFGPELSACQLESRTPPVATIAQLGEELLSIERVLRSALGSLKLNLRYKAVAPESMPLTVYPDVRGRNTKIAQRLTPLQLSAACRAAGTHFHVGMPNLETAVRVYSRVREHCKELNTLGDLSQGQRLKLYSQVEPNFMPPAYRSIKHFHDYAIAHGFADNWRNCWHIIRLSRHGTIEFRNFDATDSLQRTLDWAEYCHKLCLHYLKSS